ncbi:neuromedin-U isoform X4 [Peromyscus californicus insignis]|uniref:neuromedin-U isoform X4 n=1 Tax=Peromyscus californicus insignis TaxID=564181 RepID=UPI0022A73F65|nr:neuromedin-U isoform X4 [Peromyscus californicus insignis]
MVTSVAELSKRRTGDPTLRGSQNTRTAQGPWCPVQSCLEVRAMSRAAGSRRRLSGGQVAGASPLLLSLLLLLACLPDACRGAPISPQRLQPEQELQLWNKVHEACSSFLSTDPRSQASPPLRELCRAVTESLQKPQFLFHYSKTEKSGNSNIVEEFQSPFAGQSRGYFLFRPRNGKRSTGFI